MGKADTPAKRAYTEEYNRENIKQVSLKLSKIYDDDIIRFLDQKNNKSGFIKELIRERMDKEKRKP